MLIPGRPDPIRAALALAGLALLTLGNPDPARADLTPAQQSAVRDLEAFIAGEMKSKDLPALAIAVVDGPTLAWSRGFGFADAARTKPATADTMFRVGSVSKLFTDLAVMRWADAGKVDIDAPVTTYLPDFQPRNPSGTPITIRQLMAHRSGLNHETPVGSYFDPTHPSLADTVRSLNGVDLAVPPLTKTKYSNAGIAVVGRVLEVVAGEPFAQAIQTQVLNPLGMTRSRFDPDPTLDADRAAGVMATGYGRDFAAPTFRMGIAPAACLDSTANDLGRFLVALMDDSKVPVAGLPRPDTLAAMFTPQFAAPGTTDGFGLGFVVGRTQGRLRVGHSGAIYGFASEVVALPQDHLGVAVLASRDGANAVTIRVAKAAIERFLAARDGATLPPIEVTQPLPAGLAETLEGGWVADDGTTFDLRADGDRLRYQDAAGGVAAELRSRGPDLMGDDVSSWGPSITRTGDGEGLTLKIDAKPFHRKAVPLPPPAPDFLRDLIGEYGWDHNVLFLLERDGRLHAQTEWVELNPLTPRGPDLYVFSPRSTYADETLRIRRDDQERATAVELGGVVFPRRRIDGEDGQTFRIKPVRPVADVLADIVARNDQPPTETGSFRPADLVDLRTVSPSLKFDIRYATANNFLGTPVYPLARAYFQRPAAEALGRAHANLAKQGYGLLIHDSYRPWRITKLFWDATTGNDRNFVANPARGSKHNRGCAVDLSMHDLRTGEPVQMVGGYDEFSDRSYPNYPGGTSRQRWLRDRLRDAMEAEGFTVNGNEWWHFDYKDWRNYPILDQSLESLDARPSAR